jgi:hypothetical protein
MTKLKSKATDKETQPETHFKVETPFGPLSIPVDEHWETYSQDERDHIGLILKNHTDKKDIEELRKEIRKHRLTIRDFSANLGFEEAKKVPNATLIMEGDYGGQIYLTCPMKLVQCKPENLAQLILDIDEQEWGCNEGEGASISFRRKNPGDGVSGGMGGGLVEKGLWIHDSIEKSGIKPLIEQVLKGEIDSIKAKAGK